MTAAEHCTTSNQMTDEVMVEATCTVTPRIVEGFQEPHAPDIALAGLLREEREANKQLRNEITASEAQTANLRQQMRQLEASRRADKERQQRQLETARQEGAEAAQAACREVEQLRLRLKRLEGEMARRVGHERAAPAQVAVAAIGEPDKRRSIALDDELQRLKASADEAAAAANARLQEQKASQEAQLRDALKRLAEQHRREMEEAQSRAGEHARKQEKQLARLTEQRVQAEQQLRQTAQRLEQAERKLQRALDALKENERTAADTGGYTASLKAELESAKRQLQECQGARDSSNRTAEQLRSRLEEEAQRSKTLAAEASRLKHEMTRLGAEHSHSAGQMADRERGLQRQLAQAQQRLENADDSIGYYKIKLDEKEARLKEALAQAEQMRAEREELRLRVRSLADALAEPQQPQPQQQQQRSGGGLASWHLLPSHLPGGSG